MAENSHDLPRDLATRQASFMIPFVGRVQQPQQQDAVNAAVQLRRKRQVLHYEAENCFKLVALSKQGDLHLRWNRTEDVHDRQRQGSRIQLNLDHLLTRRQQAIPGVSEGFDGVAYPDRRSVKRLVVDFHEQRLFRAYVIIQRPRQHPHTVGNVADRRRPVAMFGEKLGRDFQNFLTSLPRLPVIRRRSVQRRSTVLACGALAARSGAAHFV